jgi:YD repeat-containing protein
LNGTSQYVSVPNSSTINISGPITIEAWIKLNSNSGNYQDIVCRESWGQVGTGGGYEFSISSAGKVRLDLYQSHNQYTTVIGSTTVSTGVWHHVAGVFDGNQMRVYLDGTLNGSLSTTSGPASGTSPLNIGKSTYTTYYFGGLIDDVRISAAAFYSSNFTAGLGPANNTRALWRFDGQTANDFSGNGNNGTLQNGATYSADVPTVSNASPTISINHPLSNTTFTPGATMVIDATASDSDGSISNVEFYQGSTLLGSDSSAPYVFPWTSVAAGTYSLTAKAFDDLGAATTSSAISVVVASAVQHSLSLDGTSQYVSVPNSSTINISGPITIEAWIKLNSNSGNYQDIVCRESWGQVGTGGGYEFSISSAGKVRLDLYQSHNQYTTVIGSTTVSTGVWHHVAGVFDGNQMRVYLDGTLNGSLSTTSGPASGTSPLNIGKSTYTTYYFGGLIDDVRISAAALYSSNFTAGLGPANNTRALWRFDGQTANDFSGNGNNGTLQNGTSFSTNVPATGPQKPIAVAGGPYTGQLAQSITFNGSGSSDPDGTIAAYYWNFGDGTSATTANPSHTYTNSGVFTATLTVTDNSGLRSSGTASVSINGASEARLDPANQTGGGGENPLARNFNWTLPLVNLSGRAGLDLNLNLSYNSLVWTKNGGTISFDDDHGFPGPGFRLGFPTIQGSYFNSLTSKWSYILIGSDGGRTELRQVATNSPLFESADSAHVLLDTSLLSAGDPSMLLRTTDGTQLTYKPKGLAFECAEIKDRNGNFVTINYNSSGLIANIHDTLDRVITFNYSNGLLSSITQQWQRQPPNEAQVVTHTWASFVYVDLPIQTNFDSNLSVVGVVNNTAKVLSEVTLDDNSDTLANNSHFDFAYTPFGQVWKISNYAADNHLLNQRTYKLPMSPLWPDAAVQNECPRFTERRDWGQWANGDTDKTPAAGEEIVTTFSGTSAASWTMPDGIQHSGVSVQVTAPDGTFEKIYFADTVAGVAKGWLCGLPELVETFDVAGTIAQRQVFTSWEQDNETVAYELNPRVKESAIYDPALAHPKLTRITYQAFTPLTGSSYKLPRDVFEYDKDATTVLRSTRTDYVDGDDTIKAPYVSRRIFGLVKEKQLYEGDVTNGGALMSRVGFSYDESGSIQGSDWPVQHDNNNYLASFIAGRGNASTVTRYDVQISGASTTSKLKYNTAGAVVSSKNALDKEVRIDYADSFSDNNNSRGTFAYPTTVIDPDNFYSTTKYNFDFGSITYRQTPPPNATAQPSPSPTPVGPAQTFSYDNLGRLERTTSLVNNAYTRYQYPANNIRVETFSTLVANKGEAYSFTILDGFGRRIANASDHPATTGTSARFDVQRLAYDVMGRVIKTSNLAETSAVGDDPAQWQLVEGDAGSNWQSLYTQYIYDWKGRPKITTNTDGTTKSVTYEGCGCAGGEVVTLNDEGTIVNGVTKTRQKKIYSDVLGRTVKTEVWNFDGTGPGGVGRSLYSTTVTNYNVRDQASLIRQFKGAAPTNYVTDLSCPTGTCQKSELTYDGYGRLQTKHEPEQRQNPYTVTSWTYHADDSVNTVTDGRGAVTTYGYGTSGNNRRLVKSISYTLNGSLPINVSFDYDAAGNRKSMSQAINGVQQDSCDYTYDQLSHVTSETRHINALIGSATAGDYTIGYQYTLGGQVSSVTDPFSSSTNLNYDAVGRTESVTGSYAGVSYTYAADVEYRAWGAVKRHGTKTITYNNRLQPTQFRYSQYRYDYNYHPDGTLKHLIDLDDVVGSPSQVMFHYMSRDYGYDLAGRNTRVDGTDNPVVNGGIVPAPFVGYYGFDEFNNLNSRTGHYALNSDTTDSATFVDNKRTNAGWSYDANGRVLTTVDTATGTSQTWTYDAAGRQIGISEVSSGTTSTNTLSYDGDGELLYESVTTPQSTKADYLIHSTVLGTVLTKLDASGNKDITYVPANGLAFPMQTKDVNGNPTVGGVWRDVTGLQEDGKAVDPFGALIQNVQPPTGGPPPNMPFYGGTYGGVSWNQFTNANNYSSGCTLDGVRTTCQNALGQVGRGNAFVTSLSTTGTLAEFFNAGLGGLIGATQRGYSGTKDDKKYNLFTSANLKSHADRHNNIGYFLPDSAGDWADVRWTATNFLLVDTLNLGPAFGPDPQEPRPTPPAQPLPPGYKPPEDVEKPCTTRTGAVKRDIAAIARMVHGKVTKFDTGHRFPGGEINPRGQSFQTAVNRLSRNGFAPATILGFQSFDHSEGDSFQKKFNDGLWYHVVINYPKEDGDNHKLPTPLVTAHCHATDPTGASHIINRVIGP